jgi:hypothetical protein
MSYQLTDDEVTAFTKRAYGYIEMAPNYTNWAPIKSIPDGYKYTYYKAPRVPRPASSKDGRDYKDVQMSREETSVNITSFRYEFSIPRVVADMARQAGVPIWDENFEAVYRHMDNVIAHLALEGSNSSFDTVAISGLRDGGTDIGATTDALLWGTATKPYANALATLAPLNTAEFGDRTNIKWIVSSNLAPDLWDKYGAGDPAEIDLVRALGIDVIFLPMGTTTELQTYPIAPASANDGVFFMFPKDEDVWHIAEVMPVTVTMNPELNVRSNAYEGYLEWRGTVAVVQATGVQYTNSVNLA